MSNPTVLLIDYEPASIEQMKGPLQAAGYTVEVVFDGVAGLQAFNKMKPDLVLIEAMIPKKHGFEVCQEIKKSPEGKDTPVVIATSIYKGRKYRNQALQNYGCDEYLEKPVDRDDLLKVCRRYLKEVEEQAAAAAPESVSAQPAAGSPRRSDQGLDNLDAMDEREISDKLDEILGAFGDAVDEAAEAAPQPEPATVSDQDMMAELLDEVGAAEPEDLAPMPEPEPVEAGPEPEPEMEPEPEVEASVEVEEVADRVDEVFADEPAPGPAFEEEAAEMPSLAEELVSRTEPGKKILGLGVPAWSVIAAAVALLAVGGVMYFGRGEAATRESSSSLVAENVPVPASPVFTEPAPTEPVATNPAADPADPVVEQPAEAAPEPVQAEPTPKAVAAKPEPVQAQPTPKPAAAKPEPVQAKPTPKPVAAKVEPSTAKPTPEPKAAQPVPVISKPVEDKPEPKPAVSEPEPAQEKTAPAETSPPVVEPAVEARPEPVVQAPVTPKPAPKPEPAQLVRARRGELMALNSVDSPPVQTVNVAPKYHPMARKLGQQGTVLLNVLVDENGAVTEVKVVREIPKSTLNQQAVKAVRQWAYEPAMKDGVPVKVWHQVALEFRL